MSNTLATLDRRKAPRFRTALRVEMSGGKGITRDLSACGVFFETDLASTLGQVIQFVLVLEYIDPARPVRLQCRGLVVRVEPSGDKTGVAVAIKAYRLEAQAYGGMEALCPTPG